MSKTTISHEWTIIKSHIGEGAGVVGPRSAPRTAEKIGTDPNGELFRMYDDDKNLYFEGVFCGTEETSGFEPLEEFGYAFGCTEIRYLNSKDEWETL